MSVGLNSVFNSINKKYIKPWFFSNDDPDRIKAPYVISFVFLSLTVWAIIIHIAIKIWQFHKIAVLWQRNGIDALPSIELLAKVDMSLLPLISILIGTAGMFIGLYNWGKKEKVAGLAGLLDDLTNSKSRSGDGKIKDNEV